MTMSAQRANPQSIHGGEQITIRTTCGPITNEATEAAGHLRYFWSELGRLLDEAEKADRERRDAEQDG